MAKKRKQETIRKKLVGAIYEYSSDEFEDAQAVLELAFESEDELVTRLVNLLEWYHDRYNEL